jgi:hypothetical protein
MPALRFPNEERGLGQIVLGSNSLHQLIGEPGVEPVNHCGVASERPIAESIDLMKFKLHGRHPID